MTVAAADLDVLLCDADGNLFPSEGPAFVASADVTNRLLAALGVERSYTAAELRREAIGRNFRATAVHLADRHGVELDDGELERYVEEEKQAVTAHLGRTLAGDPEVTTPLARLAARFQARGGQPERELAARRLLPGDGPRRPVPVRRPLSARRTRSRSPSANEDPAVYAFAGEALGVTGGRGAGDRGRGGGSPVGSRGRVPGGRQPGLRRPRRAPPAGGRPARRRRGRGGGVRGGSSRGCSREEPRARTGRRELAPPSLGRSRQAARLGPPPPSLSRAAAAGRGRLRRTSGGARPEVVGAARAAEHVGRVARLRPRLAPGRRHPGEPGHDLADVRGRRCHGARPVRAGPPPRSPTTRTSSPWRTGASMGAGSASSRS